MTVDPEVTGYAEGEVHAPQNGWDAEEDEPTIATPRTAAPMTFAECHAAISALMPAAVFSLSVGAWSKASPTVLRAVYWELYIQGDELPNLRSPSPEGLVEAARVRITTRRYAPQTVESVGVVEVGS